jgi:hypothetical protein
VPHPVERRDPSERQASGVDVGPERHEERGEERQGREHRDRHDERAPDPHRGQEGALEEVEGAQPDRDGGSREHYGVARRVERRDEGVGVAGATLQLLTIAAHYEERIVDRHAETDQ